jgi:hypothetical protein
MGKAAAGTAPAAKIALYDKLVATNPKVERKGATVPYTSLNGHMFSYLSKEGKLALRLPPGEREAFLKKYKAKLCEAYGKGSARVRRGARFVAQLDARVEEVLRSEL